MGADGGGSETLNLDEGGADNAANINAVSDMASSMVASNPKGAGFVATQVAQKIKLPKRKPNPNNKKVG